VWVYRRLLGSKEIIAACFCRGKTARESYDLPPHCLNPLCVPTDRRYEGAAKRRATKIVCGSLTCGTKRVDASITLLKTCILITGWLPGISTEIFVISFSFYRRILGQYVKISHNHMLRNPYLLTVPVQSSFHYIWHYNL
jgi:hypothetical protein